jgi:hypothetical protein
MCDNFRDHILYISQQKKRLSLLEICYAKNCKATRTTVNQSSSMGVLARDDMHLIATNGGREKLDFVFGYVQAVQKQISFICIRKV